MMAEPKADVSPPVRKPRAGGIKSVVGEFVPAERLGSANALQWISDGCEFPKAAPGLCYVPTPVTGDKEFIGITVGSGPIFGLYQGVECFLGPDSDYEARARALLEQGEGRGVEEVLWEYLNTAGGTGPAQTSWAAAIGQADEAADTLYIGQPVIMMSRFAAIQARAAKAIFGDEETGQLWTANGTPVIASAAASDTAIVVFGWPTVYASEITAVRSINHTVNLELALAERLYGIAIDCNFALHYAVTVTDGGGGPVEVGGPLGVLTGPAFVDPSNSSAQPNVSLITKEPQVNGVFFQWKTDSEADFGPIWSSVRVNDTKFTYAVSTSEDRTYRAVDAFGTLYSNELRVDVAYVLRMTSSGGVVGQPIYPYATPNASVSAVTQHHTVNDGAEVAVAVTQNGPSSWGAAIPTTGMAVGDVVKIWATSPDADDSNVVTVTLTAAADPPNEGWTVGELRQFAADHEPPIAIPHGSNKAEILALILAALAEED